MIQQTLVEELKFIHEHIEAIEASQQAVEVELRAIATAFRQLMMVLNEDDRNNGGE